jgi:hypothetical protein
MTTYTRPALRLRPGLRVVTSCRQTRLGGQKYPGRPGRVHSATGYPGSNGDQYWYVNLEATRRAKPRPMEWYLDRELIPETLTYWPDGLEA